MNRIDEIMALADEYVVATVRESIESQRGGFEIAKSNLRKAIEALAQPAGEAEPVAWRYKAVAIVDGERVPVKEVDPNRCEFEITQSAPHDHSHMSYPLDYPKLEDYSPLCSVSTSPCKFTCVGVIDSNGDIYPEPPDAGTELYAKAKP